MGKKNTPEYTVQEKTGHPRSGRRRERGVGDRQQQLRQAVEDDDPVLPSRRPQVHGSGERHRRRAPPVPVPRGRAREPPSQQQQTFAPGQRLGKQTVGGGWVRPLGYAEKFMTAAHGYGCMTTVYSLWLDSRTPLSLDVIKYAATIMYRKMPNLRMEMAERDGRLWWREMAREVVNVEELETRDVEGAVETLLKRRYDVKAGPLWFTRFIRLSPQEQGVRDDNHNLKYKYACLFGFHHNVSDGTTNMKFCKVFLKVLNDLVQGKEIDMCQEGTFAPPLQDRLADRIGAYFLFVYMFLRRLYTCILTFGIPSGTSPAASACPRTTRRPRA
nr:uncharacterized protein LOC113813610 [Penaeus vannamei]